MMTGPAQVPGPTVAPSAWASVRLIQGASKANQWQIDSSTTRAQLTVGSDKACDWPVAAERVAAVHFELFWDGRRLWIADTHEAGGVTVDGGRLTAWQPITGRARIEFGGAVMVAECSVPAVSIPGEEAIDLEPTRRPGQQGAPGARAPAGDDDERTTLHVRPDSQGPAGKGHGPNDDRVPLHAAPTTISEMPEGMIQPYGGPPPMPPGSGMSPPAILQAKKPVMPVPTIIAEPGRVPPGMLQMPSPAGGPIARGGMGPGMPPGMGMPTPDPGGARPGMPPGMGMGMGMPTPEPAAAMRPGMMAPPMPPHGMIQPLATPTGRPAWMDRLGLPKTSVPPRTWGLIILTVAALMIVLFMGGDDKPKRRAAKPKATATSTSTSTSTSTQPGSESKVAAPAASEIKPGESKTAEVKPGEKPGESKTAEVKPGEKPGETKTAEVKPGEGKTPAPPAGDAAGMASPSQGADLLLAGRQREALAVYDELARRYPEQPGYAAIVKILKRRLVERCKDKQPGESPCPPAP